MRRRRGVHDDGAAAERLDLEAGPLEHLAGVVDQRVLGRRQPQRDGEQQPLARLTAAVERGHPLLEQDPLVGRVLVDDEEARARLGQDVAVVQLPEGSGASSP
jgi:hypothetical protein